MGTITQKEKDALEEVFLSIQHKKNLLENLKSIIHFQRDQNLKINLESEIIEKFYKKFKLFSKYKKNLSK